MNKPTGKEKRITVEHRYLTALSQIQDKGVLVFDNYPSCCGSCTYAEIEQDHPGTDHISFHNSQGRKLIFKNGMPYNEEESDDEEDEDNYNPAPFTRPATELWWNFSTMKAAKTTAEVFKDNGFDVDWNGTEYRAVGIVFKEWLQETHA